MNHNQKSFSSLFIEKERKNESLGCKIIIDARQIEDGHSGSFLDSQQQQQDTATRHKTTQDTL
jgi:hypothetical protein